MPRKKREYGVPLLHYGHTKWKSGGRQVAPCGYEVPNVEMRRDQYLRKDPRNVTCGNCKRSKIFKAHLERLQMHLSEGGCNRPNCKACHQDPTY